jgi:hypothetical protein
VPDAFQADDEGSIPFTRSNIFNLWRRRDKAHRLSTLIELWAYGALAPELFHPLPDDPGLQIGRGVCVPGALQNALLIIDLTHDAPTIPTGIVAGARCRSIDLAAPCG